MISLTAFSRFFPTATSLSLGIAAVGRRISNGMLGLLLASALGTGVLPGLGAQAEAAEVGETYYTQYNFWVEKDKSVTTNYSRGELIPFNTQARLVSVDKKQFVISVDGREIRIINKPKFTLRDTATIASELLKKEQVNVSGVDADRLTDMRNGVLRLGMSKEQAIITRGHPPRHETPSTDANRWIYWPSRFVKLTLVFENGKLTQGRGLY